MLLTFSELERVSRYGTVVMDKSVTRRVFEPFWDYVVKWVPEEVAPNMVSLAGLLCLVQAWYLSYTQGSEYPYETTTIAIILIFLFWTLDSIDQKHAVRIRNDNTLTEFFDHMCSSIGTIFLVLTVCECYGLKDMQSIWHYVQIGQLLILNKHLGALRKDYVSYRLFTGPGEGVTVFILLLAVRASFPLQWFDETAAWALDHLHVRIPASWLDAQPDLLDNPGAKLSRTLFFWMWLFTFMMTFRLDAVHRVTQVSLILCLLYLLVPSGILMFTFDLSLPDVISRGLVTAIIGSDLVVARMAGREIHPWVVIINMAAVVSNLFSFVLVPFYYVGILFLISHHTRLPILTRVTNVYFDGVFDMPHIGHMMAFKNAAKFGTRLFVGVVNDEDATPYKRRPVMTAQERYDVVAACKHVYEVIPDAPCTKGALDEEFLNKHRIHVVAHGEEYDKPEDEWYGVPRKLGMCRILPRHDGMSTSELIRRIELRGDDLKRKSAAEGVKGKKTV